MQQMQSSLDAWRYQHRVNDAVRHSQNLVREFPVEMMQPPRQPARASAASGVGSYSVRRVVSQEQRLSRERFLHLLQQLDQEEYGEPFPKKQKKGDVLPLQKEDHTRALKKHNEDISRRLHKELISQRAPRFGDARFEKRSIAGGKTHSANRQEAAMVSVESSSTGGKLFATKHQDEIAELEELLRAQRLSAASKADRVFYDAFAEREANDIVADVLLDELYDLAEEVFDEEEAKSRKKDLPPELLEIVEDALHGGPMEEVLIQKYNVDISRRHLQCLLPLQWLNDEVINFYFQLLSDRDAELVKAGILGKRSHFFNSFFYTKVSEKGYNFVNVRRWTRKIDLFAMDKVFVPVNVSNTHWCMAVIYMTEKRIQYYDSMSGSGAACLDILFKYLHDEMEHKKKQKFDPEGWKLVTSTPDTPQQTNGSDCGVFSCMFADYISQNLPLTFSQKDMEFHRHRIALHIARGMLPLEEDL